MQTVSVGGGTTPLSPGAITGKVHGGQQPVVGAAVTLWAAGVTGTGSSNYGANATKVGTATTAIDGSFSLGDPCVNGQYLYITATGGTSSGSGTNAGAALMAALPTPCNHLTTGASVVVINEVSTVAAVTALQQFMSISPGATIPWKIGAPSTNVTGLANAFTQVGNLVNVSTGVSAASSAVSVLGGVTYTNTITPDSTKINTMANVLSACINGTTSTCNSLFSDTTPGTSAAPKDTIQAAYYMATNAGGLTMPAHGGASPNYLCTQYSVPQAVFAPAVACTTSNNLPVEWSIGVSWNTSNGTSSIGTVSPYSIAVDGTGNVWTAYSCTASCGAPAASISEFNPAGQILFTPISTVALTTGPTSQDAAGTITAYSPNYASTLTAPVPSYSVLAGRVNSLAIDTNNNAWFDSFYGATPATSSGLAGVLVQVAPNGTPTGWVVPGDSPGAISIDGNNNLFIANEPVSGRYYLSELESNGQFDQGIDRQTGVTNVVWLDNLGYSWSVSSKCATPMTLIYRANTTDMEAGAATDNVTVPSATTSYPCLSLGGFADGTGGAFYADGSLYDVAISTAAGNPGSSGATIAAPYITTQAAGTGIAAGDGGLDGGNAAIVDGLGHIWVPNNPGGVSEFNFTGGAFSPLSPDGISTAAAYGFGTSYLAGLKPDYLAIDASGNIWVGASGSNMWYLVGLAAPTVSPVATLLKNNAVGVRP